MAEISTGPTRVARIVNEYDEDEGRNIVEVTRGHDGIYRLTTWTDGAMCSVDLRPIHLAELAEALDAEIKRL